MTEEPILEIKEGRHLLHEQLTDNYVSNDTALQGGEQEDGDGLRSMVSFGPLPLTDRADGHHWCKWLGQVGVRQASGFDHFHGADRQFRASHERHDRHRGQEWVQQMILHGGHPLSYSLHKGANSGVLFEGELQ